MLIELGIIFCIIALLAIILGRPDVSSVAQYIGLTLILVGVVVMLLGLAVPEIGKHEFVYPWYPSRK